jgi:hypothetical protein
MWLAGTITKQEMLKYSCEKVNTTCEIGGTSAYLIIELLE